MTTASDEGWSIVVNALGQYSVWATGSPPPAGWVQVEGPGSREACLARIGELWTDIVPRRPAGTG